MNGDASMNDEPGAQDNLLVIDPNDDRWKEQVGDWKDGETYKFREVEVEQMSPGRYKVLNAEAAQAPEEETPAEDQGEGAGAETEESAYPNPAVAKMMK